MRIIPKNNCRLLYFGLMFLKVEFSRSKEDTMSRKVEIDEEECIGCGTCEEICPEVFKLDADSEKAQVILPVGGPEDLIEEAMTTCPVECIKWAED